jgi:hypothetical protein
MQTKMRGEVEDADGSPDQVPEPKWRMMTKDVPPFPLGLSRGATQAALGSSGPPIDATAVRLRERYIAARFLQFPRPTDALRSTTSVIRWARQLLDDDRPRLAAELLHLALEEDRSQQPLWLCLIELAYLGNDPATFSELSDGFHKLFPNAETLPTIDAMGKQLLPNDPRFAHAENAVVSPDWSTPETEQRDVLRQQKLHEALVGAMAFHQAR